MRNTLGPEAPLPFRPRLRCRLRAGPACLRGLRDKLLARTLSLFSLQLRDSHAIYDSRGIERPRGHTPSSREPAGRKERGTQQALFALISTFQVSRVISCLAVAFCNFHGLVPSLSSSFFLKSQTFLNLFSGK